MKTWQKTAIVYLAIGTGVAAWTYSQENVPAENKRVRLSLIFLWPVNLFIHV
jgi:hypothetical protein